MKKIYNDVIDEELYFEKMENGLEVYYIPKPGFANKYAVLGVDFGSNDIEFIPIGEKNKIKVNEGIAHFLEHKMFEQPDGTNAFDKFSKLGANANAFTGFTMTAYLFSATDNFYESLSHLIEYVQTPYYTDENVEKEKGIIAQEIKMYQDDPDWNVYFNCIQAMYTKHHTNIDIAGTVDSIYRITPEELYKCYNTFYNPANMKLFVVGDLDGDKIIDTVKRINNTNKETEDEIKRITEEEPREVGNKLIKDQYTVSIPMFYIGYKDVYENREPKESLKLEIVSDMLFDIIFSVSGELYQKLYEEGLIIGNMTGGYLCQKDYSYAIVSGASRDPEKLKKYIDEYIDNLRKTGIDKYEFEINKKKKIGNFLKSFDSIGYIANNFLNYMFRGINFLEYLEVLKEIELEDVEKRLEEFFFESQSVLSIIEPRESTKDFKQ